MSTYTQILYQIVFSTKDREPTLSKNRDTLYKHIWGILSNKKCHLYRIGGVDDHIHIVTHIHPSIAPAMLVKDIKLSTSELIKHRSLFSHFNGWQKGYGAFTYHINSKEQLIQYVKSQVDHHKTISFKDEYIALLQEHGLEFDEKYLV